jgi:hypothetical protein
MNSLNSFLSNNSTPQGLRLTAYAEAFFSWHNGLGGTV